MSAQREKTSSTMGVVVSLLLHGIFLAGCLALDASSVASQQADDPSTTHINQIVETPDLANTKS